MVQARIHIDLPNGPWVGEVSRKFPDLQIQVLTAMPGDTAGFALIKLISDELNQVMPAIEAHDTIEEVSVLGLNDGIATVQVETHEPLVMSAAKEAGIPVEMPVKIENGVAQVDITGTHERVAEFGQMIQNAGADFNVEYIQQHLNPTESLTERQREVLFKAVEHGYYDVPRTCTLTELSCHVGIAKSTCSEIIQRVEQAIVREFIDTLPQDPIKFDATKENDA